MIENAVKYFDLENVTLEMMKKEYGQEIVDIRIQNPLDYGFNYTRLMNKGDKMTVG